MITSNLCSGILHISVIFLHYPSWILHQSPHSCRGNGEIALFKLSAGDKQWSVSHGTSMEVLEYSPNGTRVPAKWYSNTHCMVLGS